MFFAILCSVYLEILYRMFFLFLDYEEKETEREREGGRRETDRQTDRQTDGRTDREKAKSFCCDKKFYIFVLIKEIFVICKHNRT